MPAMSKYSLQAAIKLILRTLPENKNHEVQETYQVLNEFANSHVGGSDINTFNKTMEKLAEHTDKLLGAFRCYRKIFQVMGNIVQE